MPGIDRNIQKSLMAHVRGLLKSPPTAAGLTAFSVYNEKDLIAINAGADLPLNPFVFLLDTYMRAKVAALPMVIIEVFMIHKVPYELGNRNGRTQEANIHCFGRTRGERDDLASFMADYIGATFPVYTYVSGSAGDVGTFLENAEIEPDVLVQFAPQAGQEIRRDASLDLWKYVNFRFRTKN